MILRRANRVDARRPTATVGVGKKTKSASNGVFEEAFFFTPPPVFVV